MRFSLDIYVWDDHIIHCFVVQKLLRTSIRKLNTIIY